MRRSILAAIALVGVFTMAGCAPYRGLNSLPLPGDEGTGSGSYQIKVQLADADNLVANVPVMVDDVNVGTVTGVGLEGWTPTLTVSLGKDVKLPANVVAKLGQTSLLGSKHIELAPPTGQAPQGTLAAGAVIRQSRTENYPETENVLASVSMLLNGGGLQNFQTVVSELNNALGGRTDDVRDLLTQVDRFTGGLDTQTGDIISTLHGLDRLGANLAPNTQVITTALDTLPRGMATVSDETPSLVHALDALGRAGREFQPFSDGGNQRLRQVIGDLEPGLRQAADTQGKLVTSLKLLPFVIFPLETVSHEFRGDAVNLAVTLNLTNEAIDKGYLGGTPLVGSLTKADQLLHSPALQAANPLLPFNQPEAARPKRDPVYGAKPSDSPRSDSPRSDSPRSDSARSDSVRSQRLVPPVVPKIGG
jgi:phospholipid/cholesterol/gamma-HCH transport system substrate-binding protein